MSKLSARFLIQITSDDGDNFELDGDEKKVTSAHFSPLLVLIK